MGNDRQHSILACMYRSNVSIAPHTSTHPIHKRFLVASSFSFQPPFTPRWLVGVRHVVVAIVGRQSGLVDRDCLPRPQRPRHGTQVFYRLVRLCWQRSKRQSLHNSTLCFVGRRRRRRRRCRRRRCRRCRRRRRRRRRRCRRCCCVVVALLKCGAVW